MTNIQSQLDQVLADVREFRRHCEEWHEPDVDKWIAELSAIRAAVGAGDVVACIEDDNSMHFDAGFMESGRWQPGVKFYTSPPATVPVEELRELVGEWSKVAEKHRDRALAAYKIGDENSGGFSDGMAYGSDYCAAELAALIGGAK